MTLYYPERLPEQLAPDEVHRFSNYAERIVENAIQALARHLSVVSDSPVVRRSYEEGLALSLPLAPERGPFQNRCRMDG